MSLDIRWTNHLTGEEKDKFIQRIQSSEALFHRLSVLISQKEKAEAGSQLSKDSYNSPNWSHKQADSVGYLRALSEIKQLIDIKG